MVGVGGSNPLGRTNPLREQAFEAFCEAVTDSVLRGDRDEENRPEISRSSQN